MRLASITLHRVAMPLVRPFETSFGRQTVRLVLLVHVRTRGGGEGWGECVAGEGPLYSSEYVDGCEHVLRHYLAPALLAAPAVTADTVHELLGFVVGHRMAKAALEAAVLDAQLRASALSFVDHLDGAMAEPGPLKDWVDCGVSVGISPDLDTLLAEVSGYVDAGYRRIKLKIKPGWDLEPVAAVRALLGPDALLQVDANTAYGVADLDHLRELDAFDLVLIEQPFVEEDIAAHVLLSRHIQTPVCLDESIVSAQVATDALGRGATSVINVKPGRVGGYRESVLIHDLCRAQGVPVWCGGMLETGIGRAANVALAALPGFTLPGDTSASDRYFAEDLVEEPFVLGSGEHRGQLRVPTGPGTGVTVREDLVRDWAVAAPIVLPRGGE
ncbi:o-succinylbenzoate synthase [Cryobacterium melibiosiphilum]|uniref:o-succinylbenzoate synthase n=1 Tax=Cryobacterium melibiosiphilum TaxID=995039 RepID=A0A3A5MCI0_9MICO|nr:o-succinylbenzoate synthase [Cryobacterium melibiosiphilum]RJT85284.1 o-succinylbenzoate synthase [Cryobacterium melibiosiphilum]